jgi:hypothetical protein
MTAARRDVVERIFGMAPPAGRAQGSDTYRLEDIDFRRRPGCGTGGWGWQHWGFAGLLSWRDARAIAIPTLGDSPADIDRKDLDVDAI